MGNWHRDSFRAFGIETSTAEQLIVVQTVSWDFERIGFIAEIQRSKQTPWLESVSELCRPSDHRLSAKLVPTFADRGCDVVSATDPYGRIPGFLDRSRYFSFQVAPQLYSQSWADPVSAGSAGNRTTASGLVARNSATRPQRRSSHTRIIFTPDFFLL
jgi:hypothetical protein